MYVINILVSVTVIRFRLRIVAAPHRLIVILVILVIRKLALGIWHGHLQGCTEHTTVGGMFILHSKVVPSRPSDNLQCSPDREPNLVAYRLSAANRGDGRDDPHVSQQCVSPDCDVVDPSALDH